MSEQITREPVKTYKDIDRSILKPIPNPSEQAYEIKIKIPEFTFLGVKEQPDFAVIYCTFYPGKKIIELKSLKQYVFQLRNIVVSYERLINIIYDDSDWKIRGGKEQFNDWQIVEDEWSVEM